MRSALEKGLTLLCLLSPAAAVAQGGPKAPPQALAKAPAGAGPVWNPSPAEPRDLVVLGRLRNPDATIAALQGLVPVPNLRGTILGALGPAGAAMAPGAPLDVAVALDPEGAEPRPPMYALAVGVSSVDAARKAIEGQLQGELREIGRGVFAARLFSGSAKEAHCLLGPAPSPAPAPLRLACGDKPRDVSALGPFLIRLAPGKDLGPADLHAELRVAPAYQRYGEALRAALRLMAVAGPQKLQLGDAAFDRALSDAIQGLSSELQLTAADLDRATVDLSLGQGGVDLRAAYRLRGRTSWLAAVLKEEAGRAAAPPPVFFRLPKDSRNAYWVSAGLRPERAAPATDVLWRLLDGYLGHVGLPAPDRKAIADLFKTPWPERPVAWSAGPMDPPAAGAKAPKAEARSAVDLLGTDYSLGGFEGPPDELRAFLQGAVAAYNRAAVQGLLRKKLKEMDVAAPLPVVKTMQVPKDLGPGSFGVQITVSLPEELPGPGNDSKGDKEKPDSKKPKAKTRYVPTTLHLVVAAGGAQTWLGFGAHLPTVLRRLREQPRLAEEATLARREGLEPLKARGVSGGYWTVAGLGESIWRLASRAGKRPPGEMAQLLASAPSHGETPMLFTTMTREGQGGSIDREVQLRVPRPSIEDLIAIVVGLSMKN